MDSGKILTRCPLYECLKRQKYFVWTLIQGHLCVVAALSVSENLRAVLCKVYLYL
eukprot:XP_001708987.1 Hypothetical protein GL50803_27923 [Giardia lamblia ATCC 50803]